METIRLENVMKNFEDGTNVIKALKPTSFTVEKGKFVAIIGPSGSGKSTLLTILGLLQKPTQGDVYVDGMKTNDQSDKVKTKTRFEKIGFIFQSSNLIPFLRVKEQFVLIDKLNRKDSRAYREQLFNTLDIKSIENKHINELSGGQRQRVAIARALYNRPSIILADEPTASLDTQKAYEVVNLLSKIAKEENNSVLMVTHDLRMSEKCDSVYEMKDGLLTKIR